MKDIDEEIVLLEEIFESTRFLHMVNTVLRFSQDSEELICMKNEALWMLICISFVGKSPVDKLLASNLESQFFALSDSS